ncbi:TetR/AcrR family transcriptional regulator [Mycobacteroides abscessus]|uniref:TetR/AcrR family transcriptional regulator n=1 Tax=Mycobacteroides abscessus TaxID=36809 RepID=UPI0009A92677|nr:TetR/AcrR family transcriptional regulator [Mycobacteroides abscessus]
MSVVSNGSTKWERTHERILDIAVQVAAAAGLSGLSISGVADELNMSKSGLYAHFSSKQQLQLATIDAAWGTFSRDALRPAMQKRGSGLLKVCELFLSRPEPRVFSYCSLCGVVPNASGPWSLAIRERIAEIQRKWSGVLQAVMVHARDVGELDVDVDVTQLAFELSAMLFAANMAFILYADSTGFEHARVAIHTRLMPRGRFFD